MELRDNTNNQISDGARIAFPAYRVFIYGKEVTQDVFAVNAHNSGGSAERTAGTATISLVNNNKKYSLTFGDMHLIGQHSQAYQSFVRESDWDLLNFDEAAVLPLFMRGDPTSTNAEAEGAMTIDQIKALHDDLLDPPDTMSAREQTLHLDAAKKDSAKIEQDADLDISYQQRADNITKASFENPYSATNLAGWQSSDFGESGKFKADMLQDKLNFITEVTYDSESTLDKLQDRTIMEYPLRQGDSIFHFNDPVRICFRDPFDPRIWYWQFTGFVDMISDSEGDNEDSTLTISCTDVTKMARYSYIQIGVGLQDPDISSVVRILQADQAKTGAIFTKELFQGFTMLEVLQTLFFGTSAVTETLEDTINTEVALVAPEEIDRYLKGVDQGFFDEASARYLSSDAERRELYRKFRLENRQKSLINLQMPALSVPAPYMRGVSKGPAATPNYGPDSPTVIAKRAGASKSVDAFFYGEVDEHDKVLGSQIPSLFDWNEKLHHRVRKEDLTDMAIDPGSFKTHVGGAWDVPAAFIMEIVGKNIKDFPVGHGKVYYLSRARFASGDFGRLIIDQAIGGASGLFSIFKDKLSFLYDLADRVDFRFYATPRGDFVYEMPFYDFDPADFLRNSDSDSDVYTTEDLDELFDLTTDGEIAAQSLAEIENYGFYQNPDSDTQIRKEGLVPEFDYGRMFTIEKSEQSNGVSSLTDRGISTVFRCRPNYVAGNSALNDGIQAPYQAAVEMGSVPTLGVRVAEAPPWGFIDSKESAQAYAALTLARINAEATAASVAVDPKFGLMVNRPIHWKSKNYYANIVGLQHSIVWNSSADTSIDFNSIRGWCGEVDQRTGKLIHRHFSGTDRPFSMAAMLDQKSQNVNKKG